MHPDVQDVAAGKRAWAVVESDCLTFLHRVPDDFFTLTLGSPPYDDRRQYGALKFKKKDRAWVEWALPRFELCLAKTRGLVCWVMQGKTRHYAWSGIPVLLMARLMERGWCVRRPLIFHRVGIAGSGNKDYLRMDYEFIVVAQKRPERIVWANPKATGQPPKYGEGGAMSHRLSSGDRRNQWGCSASSGRQRREHGRRQKAGRPSHEFHEPHMNCHLGYQAPAIVNPGDVLKRRYTAGEVATILQCLTGQLSDVLHCKVGGGHMGHAYAHLNEAPYPTDLVRPLVLTYALENDIVYDPFCGSGTTGHVCVANQRRFVGTDIRGPKLDPAHDQVALARERLAGVQPLLFAEEPRTVPWIETDVTAEELTRPFLESPDELH